MAETRLYRSRATIMCLAFVAVGLLTLMDAAMKVAVGETGASNLMFWRGLVITILTAPFLYRGGMPALLARQWPILVLRSVFASGALFFFIYAIARLPLADVIAIDFIFPILVVVLGAPILGEAIDRRSILSCVLGLAGVVVITGKVSGAILDPVSLMPILSTLLSALCYALNLLLLRRQSKQVPLIAAIVMPALISTLIGLGAALATRELALPAGTVIGWIVLVALLALGGQFIITHVYSNLAVRFLAPIEYSALLWALALGVLMFDEPIGPWTLVGASLIIGGCALATIRSRRVAPA